MEGNGRNRYFTIDKSVSSEDIQGLLEDVDIADKPDIDNLMNDCDTENIAEEEIKLEKETQDTLIITNYQLQLNIEDFIHLSEILRFKTP